MSKIDTNVLHDGQLAVATVDQSGTITKKSAINTNILVQTEDGEQLCVATYPLNGGGGGYVLLPATASKLGGIKVGANLTVEADGTLNATGGGSGADTSLSNLTDAGEIKAAHLAMPSDTYDTLTVGNSGDQYTAPSDGYFYAFGITSSGNAGITMFSSTNNETILTSPRVENSSSYSSPAAITCSIVVSKGEKITMSYDNISWSYGSHQNTGLKFFYANGTKSEKGA